MTKKKLLDLIKKNKNTEHVALPIKGRVARGYDYNELFCVVYIKDSNHQSGPCISNIRIASSNNGEHLDWILIPVEEMKNIMKTSEYIWEEEFYFEFEEGTYDWADSISLKVLKVDKDYITLVEDQTT